MDCQSQWNQACSLLSDISERAPPVLQAGHIVPKGQVQPLDPPVTEGPRASRTRGPYAAPSRRMFSSYKRAVSYSRLTMLTTGYLALDRIVSSTIPSWLFAQLLAIAPTS
jgi:hypothetical protein